MGFIFSLALLYQLFTFSGLSHAEFVDYTSIETPKGDHIPDFSFCGYHSSEKAIPRLDPTITLKTDANDQTTKIQDALNKVSAGGGGVIALAKGNFKISPGLMIPNNTVLRGAGMGQTILSTSNGTADLITMGTGIGSASSTATQSIVDKYIPVGATSFKVASTVGLTIGANVWVQRAVTQAWIDANGMSERDLGEGPWMNVSIGNRSCPQVAYTYLNEGGGCPTTTSQDRRHIREPNHSRYPTNGFFGFGFHGPRNCRLYSSPSIYGNGNRGSWYNAQPYLLGCDYQQFHLLRFGVAHQSMDHELIHQERQYNWIQSICADRGKHFPTYFSEYQHAPQWPYEQCGRLCCRHHDSRNSNSGPR